MLFDLDAGHIQSLLVLINNRDAQGVYNLLRHCLTISFFFIYLSLTISRICASVDRFSFFFLSMNKLEFKIQKKKTNLPHEGWSCDIHKYKSSSKNDVFLLRLRGPPVATVGLPYPFFVMAVRFRVYTMRPLVLSAVAQDS